MNLNKRSYLVIVPVIFLSYCMVAIAVYFSLERTIKDMEQSALNPAVEELASSFNQYSSLAESYLITITNSTPFQQYLDETSNHYQHNFLAVSIEKNLRSFKHHNSEKVSLLIVDQQPTVKESYYFELSDDPFAQPSDSLKDLYKETLQKRAIQNWSYSNGAENPLISFAKVIDKITFEPPVAARFDDSVVVLFSIKPTDYLALKETVRKQYGATITVSDELAEVSGDLSAHARLGVNKMLAVEVPSSYLEDKLKTVQIVLFFMAIALFVLSSLLLHYLLDRYITGPISLLESELSDVMSDKKANIEITHSQDDEIGRLEYTFHKLYGDLSRSYLKTRELAEQDRLTKLYNLSYINIHVDEAILEAEENETSVAFIYIDLDNFKFVNDQFGHDVGDELLKAFASRLSRVVRSMDMIFENSEANILQGRIAGDEFCLVVRNVNDETVPNRISLKIQEMFENGFHFEKGQFPVTASIGIAMYPRDGENISQLMSNADNAMYQAKASGKNQIAFYSKELAAQMRRRKEIENELKSIHMDDEFYLTYMPLVDAQTNEIDGFEALLRWESKRLGMVGPDEFIPIAEGYGLFDKIDSWVVEEALKEYPKIKEKLGRDFKISINLSSAQLNVNLIGSYIQSLVEKYQIAPEFVQLEMTETLNIEYTQQADALLNTLSEKGFKLAIDDFGTGYTSFAPANRISADMIKFDKAYMEKALRDENREMLAPLISLCHSQGLKVTVEGVETEEIRDYLISIGSDYLQGYYFGKPVRVNDLSFSETVSKRA